jgi:hypothetical protein
VSSTGLVSQSDLDRLGPFVQEHGPFSRAHVANLIAASAFTLLCWIPAVYILAFRPFRDGPNVETSNYWVALGLGLLGLFPFCFGVLFLLWRMKWRVFRHQNGLVVDRNGRVDLVLWDEVKEMYERMIVGRGPPELHIRLITEDGRTVKIDPTFQEPHALSAGIRAGVTASVLTRAVRSLDRDEWIDFGALSVSRSGLRRKGKELPWANVDRVKLAYTGAVCDVQIWRKGGPKPWYSRFYISMPNASAFLELAARFTTVASPE